MNKPFPHMLLSATRPLDACRGSVCAGLLVLWAASVGGSAWALETTPAELDTLFYSPAQRADIVGARQPQSGAPGTSVFGTVQQLTGVVRRSGGKSTVWVNGKPMQEGAAKTPPVQGVDAVVNGKRLRVGESVDALTGARADVVAPGAVTVRGAK
jgi:hypothetical protein